MLRLSIVLLPFAIACGTTSDAAPAPPSGPTPAHRASSGGDLQALCVDVFTHNRTCTDTYIPALVDLRAKYDQPAGIAADVARDRDGVIAQAKAEWAGDSTDSSIAAHCAQLATTLTGADRADAPAVRACLQQQDCGAYTSCVMPHFEKHLAK